MIALSRHTVTLIDANGKPLAVEPVSASLGMDEEWSPRIQGSLTIHDDDATALLNAEYLTIRFRQTFGPDLSVAAITEKWGGNVARITADVAGDAASITREFTTPWNKFERISPLAEFTAKWGGEPARVTAAHRGDASEITAAMRVVGGAYLPPAPVVLTARVRVAPESATQLDNLITYTLDGIDLDLHDYRRIADTTWTSNHTSIRNLVAYLLDFVDGDLAPGTDTAIPAGTTWMPGQTIFDMLHPVLEAISWRLYADETGFYQLHPERVDATEFVLDYDENLIDYSTSTERPYDAAVIEYTGGPVPLFETWSLPNARRVMHETREQAVVVGGAARALVERAQTRRHTAKCDALSNYKVRPSQSLVINPKPGVSKTATVASVRFDYPSSRMDVDVRDLI